MIDTLYTIAAGLFCMGIGALITIIVQAARDHDRNYRDHYALDPAMAEYDTRRPEDM